MVACGCAWCGVFFRYGEGAKAPGTQRSTAVRAYVAADVGGPWRSLGDVLTAAEVVAGFNRQHDAQVARQATAVAKGEAHRIGILKHVLGRSLR